MSRGRGRLFRDILWRWMAMWTAAPALLITVIYLFDGDGGEALGDVGPGSAVLLGILYGVSVGVAFGGPSGLLVGVLAAALLVPYRGKSATVRIMCALATVSATVPVAILLGTNGYGPDDAFAYLLTAGVAVYAVVMSRWLVAGYVSRTEAEPPKDAALRAAL